MPYKVYTYTNRKHTGNDRTTTIRVCDESMFLINPEIFVAEFPVYYHKPFGYGDYVLITNDENSQLMRAKKLCDFLNVMEAEQKKLVEDLKL